MQIFEKVSFHSAERANLRFAMVTDKQLIKKMKKEHPKYFLSSMYSCITLVRYDGKIVRYDLNEER